MLWSSMVAPTSTADLDDLRVTLVGTRWRDLPMRVRLARPLDDDELLALCAANSELRIERTADGELIVMPPAGSDTSRRNFALVAEFSTWVKRDGTGIGFDSSGGFKLSNGAVRAADLAWVRKTRWDELAKEQQQRYAPLCPDFVLELVSPSDRLPDVQDKLGEYIACGARLGWLIDPFARRAHIYRPHAAVEVLEAPPELSGDPELPGLILDLRPIW